MQLSVLMACLRMILYHIPLLFSSCRSVWQAQHRDLRPAGQCGPRPALPSGCPDQGETPPDRGVAPAQAVRGGTGVKHLLSSGSLEFSCMAGRGSVKTLGTRSHVRLWPRHFTLVTTLCWHEAHHVSTVSSCASCPQTSISCAFSLC